MKEDKKSLFKAALMTHYKQPKNKQSGEFPSNTLIARGRNPRCGDDIQVGVKIKSLKPEARIESVTFKGRGCSVCLASASMMTEAVSNLSPNQIKTLSGDMQAWIDNTLPDPSVIPEVLRPLEAVKDHPARKKCVMLAWHALMDAIANDVEAA